MKSWILALVAMFVVAPAHAETRIVPPIPGPGEVLTPAVPLDSVWPVVPQEVALAELASREIPAVPANGLVASAVHQTALAVPPIPAPGEGPPPASPLDQPWPESPATLTASESRNIPSIPGLVFASAPAPQLPELATATGQRVAPAPRRAFHPEGTIHVVETGDTLWDISDLYLGTPWIWPSVWQDNDDIENPHLILPGDKIWVSATEMRKVTDEEAAALLAGSSVPAAMAEDMPSVPMPEKVLPRFHYVRHASLGLVSDDEIKDLPQVVGTIEEAVLLSQGDTVFVNLGEGQVSVGDQFTLFRTSQKVYDPANHHLLGYHSEIVGWLEITRIHGETSRARIQQSYVDFIPGVYLKPRLDAILEVPVVGSPKDVEGQIADLLLHSKYRGDSDVVILNRGADHGVVAGTTFEVYRQVGGNWKPNWYGKAPKVEIPHEVVAELIVLSAEPKSAMAYVTRSNTEIWHGDRFRTVAGPSHPHRGRGFASLEQRAVRWVREQATRAVEVVTEQASEHRPEVSVPAALAGWNLPRLQLEMDGYDPR